MANRSHYTSHGAISAASSRCPSRSSSIADPPTSETSHSALEDKPVKRMILSSDSQSGDIFSLSDQQLSEKMRFIQEIGFGNWGSVWLCEPRPADERAMYGDRVAVKLVHRSKTPTTAARVRSLWNEMKIVRALRREASASGQEVVGVGHPSVVNFYSFVITPSYALITMQYLPTPVPVEVPEFRAKPWFAALTDAVSFLHQRGVVHNDIKPANILLTGASSPMPVLVDFGFAEHYTLTSRHAFQSNLAYGTPEYLAPERARGQPHDTRKADVYALGVTFFEILVGRTPFEEVEGESFVSKEDLERYWARTVKGKWVGKWEGIMSKQCEKALKRMTVPNADLRVTAMDVLSDPYFTGEEDSNHSLSVDLSALTEIIPPWSRPVLSTSKHRANTGIKNVKSSTPKRSEAAPISSRGAAASTKVVPKANRTADKENAQPAKSDTVNSRGGALHRTSLSITEAFRKSVGTSRKAPKKALAEVFQEETPKDEPTSAIKPKPSSTVLKDKNPAGAKVKNAVSANPLKEKKVPAPVFKQRIVAVKDSAENKENEKPKTQSRALSIGLSFTRSFGRKKAKEQEKMVVEANIERRELEHVSRPPTTGTTRSVVVSPTPAHRGESKVLSVSARGISPAPASAQTHSRSGSNARDVRAIFGITEVPVSADTSSSTEHTSSYVVDSSATTHSATSFIASQSHRGQYDSQNTSMPERINPSESETSAASKPSKPQTLSAAGVPRLSTITQSVFTPDASPISPVNGNVPSPSPVTPNKARVSRIAAKENRRTTVVAKPIRGTPVKNRSSPSRVRASPAATKTRGNNVPVFAIPKANGGVSKTAAKSRPTKVLGDATNTPASVKSENPSQTWKASKSKTRAEDAHDEGDDTITLPIDVFQNGTLPRVSKESNKSSIKQGFRQSIDKAIRFGRLSVSATESTHYPTSEATQHRRSLSVGETWGDDAVSRIITSSMPAVRHALQNEQMGPDGQVDRMAIWIRNVEKVVADARQSYQVEPTNPLSLPPPPPRLNHSQSTALTRISTSAKDPTIRTLTSNANPSVTTFAGAPQAFARARRATVGPSSSPGTAAAFTFHTHSRSHGGLSRPITPCLNAELGKVPEPPTSPTPPRLYEVFDPDARKLIMGPVGMPETPSYSIDYDRSLSAAAIRPSSQQSTRFVRAPSPTTREPLSPTLPSRPVTSMSMAKNIPLVESEYDRCHTTVVRNGKGYQSDFTMRGKGIENIAPKPNSGSTINRKRSSVFNRFVSSNHQASDRTSAVSRVANAFRTIVTSSKKHEPIPTDGPIVFGGGFSSGFAASRKAQTWSRAQAA